MTEVKAQFKVDVKTKFEVECMFVRGEELRKWIGFLSEKAVEIFDNGQMFCEVWIPENIHPEKMYELRPKKEYAVSMNKGARAREAWKIMKETSGNIERLCEAYDIYEKINEEIALHLAFMQSDVLKLMRM